MARHHPPGHPGCSAGTFNRRRSSRAGAAGLLSLTFAGHAAAQAPLVVNVTPGTAPIGAPVPPGVGVPVVINGVVYDRVPVSVLFTTGPRYTEPSGVRIGRTALTAPFQLVGGILIPSPPTMARPTALSQGDPLYLPALRSRQASGVSRHHYGTPAAAPCAGTGIEHAGAGRAAPAATVVGQVPCREGVPIAPDQPRVAGMAIGALPRRRGCCP